MQDPILICGGAGYIGSHMVRLLKQQSRDIVVLDNLSTGHREAIGDTPLIQADLLDQEAINKVFGQQKFSAVIHFCALSLVGESIKDPVAYYRNNVSGTLNLIDAMLTHNVDRLVFSSTAAIYGEPQQDALSEEHPANPVNPYGRSKLMVERILESVAHSHALKCVALRYFNAAGASAEADIGESHDPETHLIPNVLKSALGGGKPLKIFGTDYPTRDGTCIRDYIHVEDLARAHLSALEWMDNHGGYEVFNLGNGQGFSVKEVIDSACKVIGQNIPYRVDEKRAGDPVTLVASARKARNELGWSPAYTTIESIIETAWRWHKNQRY